MNNLTVLEKEMLKVLKQFVGQAEKMSGFNAIYQPYAHVVINAKEVIRMANATP